MNHREWGVLHNTSIYSACIGLKDGVYPVAAIHESANDLIREDI